jgi:hypothetical protein
VTNPYVRAFRNAAAQACSSQGFPFARFLGERGLEAILLDAEAGGQDGKQIACRVLAECCVTAGKFNNFQVGVLAVMLFLGNQYGTPTLDQVQLFRDLRAILDSGGSAQAIGQWLDTHF